MLFLKEWTLCLLFISYTAPLPKTMKAGLHCDISISTSMNISITNVHNCCMRLVNLTYQYLHKSFFLFVTSKSCEPGFVAEAGIIANCLGKFLVENSILRRHFGQY